MIQNIQTGVLFLIALSQCADSRFKGSW